LRSDLFFAMRFHRHDVFQFLRSLSFRRVLNIIQVTTSYHLSRWLRVPLQWGKPFNISVEPTTHCNLRCPQCPSGLRAFTRPTGSMSTDLFAALLSQMQNRLVYLYFYFQGEPFLNPSFLGMVRMAALQKLYTVTSTNAHYLNDQVARQTVESGLSRIIVSIDGTTQEVYEQYRVGGDLEKVKQGVRNLVKWKQELKSHTPHIIIQFLVVKPNEHQIEAAKVLTRELGADELKLKTAQVYDYATGSDLIPEQEQYSRYRALPDGTYALKNKLANHCWKLWHSTVITWDGSIVPCCFDKDAAHSMGSLQQSNFSTIWRGEPYKRFRKSILKSRSNIDICTNCTEGTKVWA
jgi:radical SAM protein with 4Fe4S-binding SPASM domain